MKIAIVYATKSGTVKECADILKKNLKNHEVTLFDLKTDSPNLADFDLTVFGFSIIMGKPVSVFRKYLKENYKTLLSINAAYYICCGFIDCFEEYIEKAIPKELRDAAVATSCFGGSLEPDRFKGIDKLIVKAVRSDILGGGDNGDQRKDMCLPTILETNIVQFAKSITESA